MFDKTSDQESMYKGMVGAVFAISVLLTIVFITSCRCGCCNFFKFLSMRFFSGIFTEALVRVSDHRDPGNDQPSGNTRINTIDLSEDHTANRTENNNKDVREYVKMETRKVITLCGYYIKNHENRILTTFGVLSYFWMILLVLSQIFYIFDLKVACYPCTENLNFTKESNCVEKILSPNTFPLVCESVKPHIEHSNCTSSKGIHYNHCKSFVISDLAFKFTPVFVVVYYTIMTLYVLCACRTFIYFRKGHINRCCGDCASRQCYCSCNWITVFFVLAHIIFIVIALVPVAALFGIIFTSNDPNAAIILQLIDTNIGKGVAITLAGGWGVLSVTTVIAASVSTDCIDFDNGEHLSLLGLEPNGEHFSLLQPSMPTVRCNGVDYESLV